MQIASPFFASWFSWRGNLRSVLIGYSGYRSLSLAASSWCETVWNFLIKYLVIIHYKPCACVVIVTQNVAHEIAGASCIVAATIAHYLLQTIALCCERCFGVIILSGHRATTRVSHSNHSSSKGLMKSLQPQRPPHAWKHSTEIKEVHVVGSSANHTLQVFVCMCVCWQQLWLQQQERKSKSSEPVKPNTRKTRGGPLWESAGPSQDCLENVTGLSGKCYAEHWKGRHPKIDLSQFPHVFP